MFRIEFYNSEGLIDSATGATEEDAARETAAMIRKAGTLCDGDKIFVHEVPED